MNPFLERVILFVICLIWGIVCAVIMERKDRSAVGGFALGFFLGLIGLIIVCCKKNVYENYNTVYIKKKDEIPAGGWKCECGNVNASYVGACGCGRERPGNSR